MVREETKTPVPVDVTKNIEQEAQDTKFEEPKFEEIFILALPNVSEENFEQFGMLMAKMQKYLPFSVAITKQKIQVIGKQDIIDLKEQINHICEVNNWQ